MHLYKIASVQVEENKKHTVLCVIQIELEETIKLRQGLKTVKSMEMEVVLVDM